MSLTEAKQERVDEYNWSRVPTYEGGRRSKRVATSEGGTKYKPPEHDVNMYEGLSKEDKEDKEMELAPSEAPTGPNCPILQEIARNYVTTRAQAERRTRRQKRQVIKEVDEVIKETKNGAQTYQSSSQE